MKTSNKILLAFSIVPLIIIAMMLFSFNNILKEEAGTKISVSDQSNYLKKTFDLSSFEEIRAQGVWEIVLTSGDQYKVELEQPSDTEGKTSVTQSGNTLLLSSDKSFSIFKRPRINITMPSISKLDLEGLSNVKMCKFKLSKMDIGLNGIASLTGTGSTIEQFSFSGGGIVNATLKEMPVTNANLNFSGIHLIEMNIKGGELSGRLSGPGKLTVTGNISKNSLYMDNPRNLFYIKAP